MSMDVGDGKGADHSQMKEMEGMDHPGTKQDKQGMDHSKMKR